MDDQPRMHVFKWDDDHVQVDAGWTAVHEDFRAKLTVHAVVPSSGLPFHPVGFVTKTGAALAIKDRDGFTVAAQDYLWPTPPVVYTIDEALADLETFPDSEAKSRLRDYLVSSRYDYDDIDD